MMSWKFIKLIGSVLVIFMIGGCYQSDYTKLVKEELAKGVRQDSILLGLSFGNTRNEFYGRCFDLNKKQLVSQGPDNASVQYVWKDSLVHDEPTDMRLLFYPGFDEQDKISNMDMEFSYLGWAPWNTKLQSDSLEIKVRQLLLMWYKGNDFVMANSDDVEFPVKVDGNRRIIILIKDAQTVRVLVQDILHPKFMHSVTKEKFDDK